jgi:dTDP-4-dehydrorhamnose reductase
VHVYGASKAAGEEAVLAATSRALVVRLPLLYGESFGRGLGASDQLLAALARGERPVLFRDEYRTPLEVSNAAAAVLELLAGEAHGRLHVAGPERLDRHALASIVLAARGLVPATLAGQLREGTRAEFGLAHLRPADVSLDAARARARLATELLTPAEALARWSKTLA